MVTALVVSLFLAAHLNAESIVTPISTTTTTALVNSTRNSTTKSPPFNMDEELAKIANTCLTHREQEQLSGNILKHVYARLFIHAFIRDAEEIIGLTEMRAALGMSPPGPWTHYKEPSSADELAAANLTVAEYFYLREPRSERLSLDSDYFFEKNFPPVIAFLDERFPSIRNIYKRKFEEILDRRGGTIDRKAVDDCIYEFISNILPRQLNAADHMTFNKFRKCAHIKH